ncbi:hypothetical protein IKF57_02500 [Candidatus Saccharibacteria bacterium]|nr:hypothetical protein [Candidatus Saccharibacteria bacterium]
MANTRSKKVHRSFRRSYREDYQRDLNVPGIMHHIFESFKMIFQNWKLFLPLLVIVVILNIVLIGLMSQETYQNFHSLIDEASYQVAGNEIGNFPKAGLLLLSTITTGGLSSDSNEAALIIASIIFLIIWLTTIFLLRHRLAGNKVKLRDGLYNAMTPLISTFVVFIVAAIQCIPIFILIIFYSAAIQTEFLTTPFYAFLFFAFAALMILISSYLLSSSLMALVAVSAPGLYPLKALNTASALMMSRRFRFIIRLLALIVALIIMWVVIMLPLILFDLWMKTFEWTAGIPFIPICLNIMTCFTCIYVTTYLYLYYRWMLGYDEK